MRRPQGMDADTKAVIETIGAAGFTVQLYGQDGQNVVEAVNEETGVVRGTDLSSWSLSGRSNTGSSWRMGRRENE